MTRTIAQWIFLAGFVTWYLIRLPHEVRSYRTRVSVNRKDWRERGLVAAAALGLAVIPIVNVFSGFPRWASYTFQPAMAYAGAVIFAGALVLFFFTHRALGRFWSPSLQIREQHRIVDEGPYRVLRHPMYAAFFLWAVAQALLLPNWIAGPAGLAGFGALYAFRVEREEALMLQTFGETYRTYMQRTARLIPYVY